jgi:hypothetical protein
MPSGWWQRTTSGRRLREQVKVLALAVRQRERAGDAVEHVSGPRRTVVLRPRHALLLGDQPRPVVLRRIGRNLNVEPASAVTASGQGGRPSRLGG